MTLKEEKEYHGMVEKLKFCPISEDNAEPHWQCSYLYVLDPRYCPTAKDLSQLCSSLPSRD